MTENPSVETNGDMLESDLLPDSHHGSLSISMHKEGKENFSLISCHPCSVRKSHTTFLAKDLLLDPAPSPIKLG